MNYFLRLAGATVLSIVLGLGSAFYGIRYMTGSRSVIQNGAWFADMTTGGADATMYTRARVAIVGLLALNRSETIYFTARRDSAGDALDGHCSYRIEGRDPDARWWSITAYASDNYLIDHPAKRYSVSKNSVARAPDGSFVVRLSTSAEPNNWIATSVDGFDVTLRLYNPGEGVIKDPAAVSLPSITKEACS